MQVLDLRLVPAAVAVWGMALVLVGSSAEVACWVAVGAGTAAVVAVVLRHRGPAVGQCVLVAGAACCVAATVAGQLALMGSGPFPALVERGATAVVVAEVVSEPTMTSAGFGGEPRYLLRVRAQQVETRDMMLRPGEGLSEQSAEAGPAVVEPEGAGASVVAAGGAARVHGDVVVLGGAELREADYGSVVILRGTLRKVDPGSRTVAMLMVRASSGAQPAVVMVDPPGAVHRVVNAIRADFADIARALPAQARGLVPGVAVGDTSMLPTDLDDAMKVTSLTHITAVSGSHFAIIFVAVFGLCSLLRLPRWARLSTAALLMTGFVLLVHPEPSVLRAAAMGAVTLLALALGRTSQAVAALCTTVIVLLVLDPFLARSYGFALSVLATAGLVLGTAPITRRLEKVLPSWLALAVAVPLAAQLACAPVLVLLDPSVAVFSVPANLLAAPALVPATIFGVVGALCAPWWPEASWFCAQVAGWATWWIAEVATFFAGLPGARLPWVPGALGALLLAVVTGAALAGVVFWSRAVWSLRTAGFVVGLWGPPSTPQRTSGWRRVLTAAADGGAPRSGALHSAWRPLRRGFMALTVCLVCLLIVWSLRPPWLGGLLGGTQAGPQGWPPDWEIAQCDVGQGDALVVQTEPGHAIMVDVGPAGDAAATCLQELSVTTVDLLVLTHFHADHVGGLPEVLDAVSVTQVLVSPLREPADQARAVTAALEQAGVGWLAAEEGMAGAEGAAQWQVLAAGGLSGDVAGEKAANDASVVLGIRTMHLSLVALGDLEADGQARLRRSLVAQGAGRVDVVKMAHHGSRTQDARLAELLSPEVVLVSSGVDNTYGHPTQSALDLFRSTGSAVLRTDTCGTVGLLVEDGQTLVLGRCE